MEKAIFKFNNGNGALLCSKCRTIIKIGKDFDDLELKAIRGKIDVPSQYCDKCKNKLCQEEDLTTTNTK
jgi:hypothetical protein